MEAESFAKLSRLKRIVGQMSIAEKVAFVAEISGRLTRAVLNTSEGTHAFNEENIRKFQYVNTLATANPRGTGRAFRW